MTTAVMNYVSHPFEGMLSKINNFFMIVGYARAASELSRLGYHKEAQNCINQMVQLKSK